MNFHLKISSIKRLIYIWILIVTVAFIYSQHEYIFLLIDIINNRI